MSNPCPGPSFIRVRKLKKDRIDGRVYRVNPNSQLKVHKLMYVDLRPVLLGAILVYHYDVLSE